MRIAVLADIHGNLPAFEATLEHLARHRVDQVVIAGDIVLGAPDSAGCWDRACELGCPVVRGNGESFVAQFGGPDADPEWRTERFAPLQWAVQEFSDETRRTLGALPLICRFPEISDLLFFHASPRSEWDGIRSYTPEAQLGEMFSGASERFLVRGHNHDPQVRLWGERVIIGCGSVGIPIDGNPAAQYVLLEQYRDGWRIRHQSVAYDVDAALRRFHETGYLEATGPMGRLFMRTLATATEQIVPFLGYYRRWSEEADITLTEAVDRFLNLF